MQLDDEESTPAQHTFNTFVGGKLLCPTFLGSPTVITVGVSASEGPIFMLQDMNYFLVLGFGQVTTDRRTDRQTERDA